jgi:release factor glutamine methyltransferase
VTLIGALRREIAERLRAQGVDNPWLDAKLLMAEALHVDYAWLFNHEDDQLELPEIARIEALVRRRCNREPISLILGRREFWSLQFQVTADSLAPRADSETLIEAALTAVSDREAPLSLLDLGTGTGCLLLALLSELPNATGIGVDLSPAALAVAEGNAARLGLAARSRWVESDWCARLDGRFDVILANPPYIVSTEIAGLAPEVAHYEPRLALDGGADGYDAYRKLAAQLSPLLTDNGVALFEVGIGQAAEVARLLVDNGLVIREIRRDLAGVERCVVASH